MILAWNIVLEGVEPLEQARLTFAPEVPPALVRKKSAVVRVDLETTEVEDILMTGLEEDTKYVFWAFNGKLPGPFVRVRVGDTIELHITNPRVAIGTLKVEGKENHETYSERK